jgi:propionyl-CoA carboxylase beta chain
MAENEGDWSESEKRLLALRRQAEQGGGAERLQAQHQRGKLSARERIGELVDPGSFQELGGLTQHRVSEFGMEEQRYLGDGLVAGFATIDGRQVCVYAQDFTVLGGSVGEVAGRKLVRLMDTAMGAGVPVIALNDGGGARIQEGVYSLEAYGELFYRNALASGVIPQISLILGPCAGGAAYSPALTDFVVMVDGLSTMFITGPDVIKTVTGEQIDAEALGGSYAHAAVSGVAHFSVASESDALELTRRLLSYLPENNAEPPPARPSEDDPDRTDNRLNTLVPQDIEEPYDMRVVLESVFDTGTLLEVQESFAPNVLVGFARLAGQAVGFVAQQPLVLAGVIDINAADKIARFVRFCDAFNFPIFTFSDSPGFLPGVAQEHGGIIRHGAKIIYAYAEASVPTITVITRKAYGGAYIVMGSKHLHADWVFAWPSAEIAVMGAEGAVNILHRRELGQAANVEEERDRLTKEYWEKFGNPWQAAAGGHVDEVILPSETRPRLVQTLALLRDKQTVMPARKHGCMPL